MREVADAKAARYAIGDACDDGVELADCVLTQTKCVCRSLVQEASKRGLNPSHKR